MKYTPITNKDEVQDAYEWLRKAFQANADQEFKSYNYPAYQHDRFNLWGAFSHTAKNRYWIGFGKTDSKNTVFEANPPKRGVNGRLGQGLFVKDDKGKRYLTHSGNFNLPEGHEAARGGSRETFRKFVDSDQCWISVSGKKEKRYLITELDVEAPTLFKKIRNVVDTVDKFKFKYPQSKSTGAAEPNSGGDVQHNQSLSTILYGPPGTGKTWNTVNRALAIIDDKPVEDYENKDRKETKERFDELKQAGQIEMVTFHQNYAYEDFIEGIRPVLSKKQKTVDGEKADKSDIKYELSEGIFKRIARCAEKNRAEEKNYVLIIDEINRGNIAKIFGELITLIEESKRLGEKDEATATLPYSKDKEPFGIPNNLYIIGTMNTADRSIALLDTALRRRFYFIEMMPDPEQLKDKKIEGVNCQELLRVMNERIRRLHDREHQIGHTYFMDVKDMASLAKTFKNRIIPLLQEYFYDNWEKIDLVLNKNGFIQERGVDNHLFQNSDLVDTERKIYELMPTDNKKWEHPDSYIKIYQPKNQPPQNGQDSEAD